jgi:hypothetical protein
MRPVAFAFALLSLAALTPGAAAAQNFGPGPYADDPRSGPPRRQQDMERPPYFTDRPPAQRDGFGPQPLRGEPPDRGQRYERAGDDRPGARPAPYPGEREPPPAQRRAEKPPRPPETGDRQTQTIWPPVRPGDDAAHPSPERRPVHAAPRRADRMTVSVEEFRDLQNRVRELERLLAERRDFRDVRRGPERPPNIIYR